MATAKQITANRRNAQKATGPRTTRGKAASRFNSLKHGIFAIHQFMFDETAEDLAELTAEYDERHSPSSPEERALVDTLIANEWRLRRMRRVEVHLWEVANLNVQVDNLVHDLAGDDPCSSGEAFAADSPTFERLQRVVNCCERAYHRALEELRRLQAEPAPQTQHVTASSANLVSLQQIPRPADPGPVSYPSGGQLQLSFSPFHKDSP